MDYMENPLLDLWLNRGTDSTRDYRARERGHKLYAWAIPTDEALATIAKYSPIIEIGAGTGYWAALLQERGTDVLAFDIYQAGPKHTKVLFGSCEEIQNHPERTLFLCWPPYKTPMAIDCLKAYRGRYLIYVGEGDGGCTGDDAFHALLCREWKPIEYVKIPRWLTIHDRLVVYERKMKKRRSSRRRS